MNLLVPFRHNEHCGVFFGHRKLLYVFGSCYFGVYGLVVARQWWVVALLESPVSGACAIMCLVPALHGLLSLDLIITVYFFTAETACDKYYFHALTRKGENTLDHKSTVLILMCMVQQ